MYPLDNNAKGDTGIPGIGIRPAQMATMTSTTRTSEFPPAIYIDHHPIIGTIRGL
jgi:hypothetical protein